MFSYEILAAISQSCIIDHSKTQISKDRIFIIKRFSLNIMKDEAFIECEFLSREFGFDLNRVTHKSEIISHGKTCFIASSNPSLWIEIMSNTDLEIVFILLGNESYDIEILKALDLQSNIKQIFAYNGPRPNLLLAIRTHALYLFEEPKLCKQFNFWKFWFWALRLSQRTRKFRFDTPYTLFPLGYTDRFVDEIRALDKFSLDRQQSLIDQSITPSTKKSSELICFIGQRGNWFRQYLIKLFEEKFSLKPETYQGFGGHLEKQLNLPLNYSETLFKHRYILCPPGEVTNETFRYLESLIMGTIPIIPRITLQDHHFGGYISELLPSRLRTYSQVYNYVLEMTDQELDTIHHLSIKSRKTQRDYIRYQIETLAV